MKKTTQEQLAKAAKRNKLRQVEPPRALVAELKGEAPKAEPKKVEAAPTQEPAAEKKPKGPRVDTCLADRQMVLDGLRTAGLTVETKTAWHKVTGPAKGRRVYVQVKGPQVHLSGFTVTGDSYVVEQLTEERAKERHLGGVRGIVWLDRNNTAALRTAMKDILAAMR